MGLMRRIGSQIPGNTIPEPQLCGKLPASGRWVVSHIYLPMKRLKASPLIDLLGLVLPGADR